MTAYYSKALGHFNWAGNEKQWCVTLITSEGQIHETWDENEEPDISDMLPSEVLALIAERSESYWIDTARDRKRDTRKKMLEGIAKADAEWLRGRIRATELNLDSLKNRLSEILEYDQTGERP